MASWVLFAWSQPSQANKEMEHLLESYTIAKIETQQAPLSDEEMKVAPYTIQVASYVNEKDAASHIEELKLQEKEAYYFPAFARGQTWFKVCVGKFTDKEAADAYRRTFVQRMDEPLAVVISLLDSTKPELLKAETLKKELKADPPKTPAPKAEVARVPSSFSGVTKDSVTKETAPSHVKEGFQYSIQIGAYPTEQLVKETMTSFPLKGHDLYYKPATVKGRQWFRLYVGKFTTRKEAKDFQKILAEKAGGVESFIRKITAAE